MAGSTLHRLGTGFMAAGLLAGAGGALGLVAAPAAAWSGDTTLTVQVTCTADHLQMATFTARNTSGVDARVLTPGGALYTAGTVIPRGGTAVTRLVTKPGSFVGTVAEVFWVNYLPADGRPYPVGPATAQFTGRCGCASTTTTTSTTSTTTTSTTSTTRPPTTTTSTTRPPSTTTSSTSTSSTTTSSTTTSSTTSTSLPPDLTTTSTTAPTTTTRPPATTSTTVRQATTTTAPVQASTTTTTASVLGTTVTASPPRGGGTLPVTGGPTGLLLVCCAVLLALGAAAVEIARARRA